MTDKVLELPGPDRPLVRSEIRDGVAVFTMCDPAHRNALSLEMTTDLAAAVTSVAADDTVGAIVIAADPPVFSAGGSLKELLYPRAPLEEIYRGFEAIANASVPTVAAVGGPAIGAGVNVALACDVIICSPAASFDPRFLDLGIHPGGGLLWRLRERVGRQAAAALVLCGESVDGETAAQIGLAWSCVKDTELIATATALGRSAARRPRDVVKMTKRTLNESAAVFDGQGALALEIERQRASMTDPEFIRRVDELRNKAISSS